MFSMFSAFWDLFSWMPPVLATICRTALIVFLIVCLVQLIKLVIEIVKMIVDVFGGLFGKVVGLFK